MTERDRSTTPIVTPTFQAVLNFNVLGVMEALNMNAYATAYTRMKTLIYSLRPEHRQPLMENDVAHIDDLVAQALKVESVDLHQTRVNHKKAIKQILGSNLPGLFQKIMGLLHREGYLEFKPVQPRAKGHGRLKVA